MLTMWAPGGSMNVCKKQKKSIKTRVESAPGACNQRLRLKCDEPLSSFAFNFNVRHYIVEWFAEEVGRCRLTV